MAHRIRIAPVGLVLVFVSVLAPAPTFAQAVPAVEPPLPSPAELPPPPPPAPEPASEETPGLTAGVPPAPGGVVFGAAFRGRWISVPSWFLGLFTKENVPLSSVGFGAEFFRRKGELDLSLGLSWQRMSPADGNWLGRGKAASLDTDFVQFRNFGLIGFDASFIWRNEITPSVALRYGAGLGVALVTGRILRTSAGGCTEQNAGSERDCFPRVPSCSSGPCGEKSLKDSEGRPDLGPSEPHRFVEDDVPGAIPVLNMLAGADFRIPEVPGLELRLEGGFYNAFFLGISAGYLF